jgi:hypothetical protein
MQRCIASKIGALWVCATVQQHGSDLMPMESAPRHKCRGSRIPTFSTPQAAATWIGYSPNESWTEMSAPVFRQHQKPGAENQPQVSKHTGRHESINNSEMTAHNRQHKGSVPSEILRIWICTVCQLWVAAFSAMLAQAETKLYTVEIRVPETPPSLRTRPSMPCANMWTCLNA